jgi:hypothetical protein
MIQFTDLPTATQTAITSAPSFEQSIYRMLLTLQALENNPDYNPSNANRLNLTVSDAGLVNCALSLQTGKAIDDGSFTDVVAAYLVNPDDTAE